MSYILEALKKASDQRGATASVLFAQSTPVARGSRWAPWIAVGAVVLLLTAVGLAYLLRSQGRDAPTEPATATKPAPASVATQPAPATAQPAPVAMEPAPATTLPAPGAPQVAMQPAPAPAQPAPSPSRAVTAIRPMEKAAPPPANQVIEAEPPRPTVAVKPPVAATKPEITSRPPVAAMNPPVAPAKPSAITPAPPRATPRPQGEATATAPRVRTDVPVVSPGVRTNAPMVSPSSPGATRPNTPGLKLEVLSYSEIPAQRLVFINGRRYREGDTLDSGAKVEEIREDGVVLNDQGRRFTLR